jgi:hypothetical protein
MTDPAVNYYFNLLRTIVEDLTASGRRSFAAGLKPRLQSLSNGEFDETRLGFPTFKAFLQEAEKAGIVELGRTPSDLVVMPRRAMPPPSTTTSPAQDLRGKKIRPDLWRAWIEWSPELRRYYDKESDRVLFLVDRANDDEPENLAATRAEVAANPGRYIPIEPISSTATVEAMRDFASSWTDETDRAAMQEALASSTPEEAAMNFTRLLRVRSPIGAAWHLTRLNQVSQAIAAWKQTHQLEVQHLVPTQGAERRSNIASVPSIGIDEEELRGRILEAVQRMALSDLLRLPIPAEYLLSR